MTSKCHTTEQIIGKLPRADMELGKVLRRTSAATSVGAGGCTDRAYFVVNSKLASDVPSGGTVKVNLVLWLYFSGTGSFNLVPTPSRSDAEAFSMRGP